MSRIFLDILCVLFRWPTRKCFLWIKCGPNWPSKTSAPFCTHTHPSAPADSGSSALAWSWYVFICTYYKCLMCVDIFYKAKSSCFIRSMLTQMGLQLSCQFWSTNTFTICKSHSWFRTLNMWHLYLPVLTKSDTKFASNVRLKTGKSPIKKRIFYVHSRRQREKTTHRKSSGERDTKPFLNRIELWFHRFFRILHSLFISWLATVNSPWVTRTYLSTLLSATLELERGNFLCSTSEIF